MNVNRVQKVVIPKFIIKIYFIAKNGIKICMNEYTAVK